MNPQSIPMTRSSIALAAFTLAIAAFAPFAHAEVKQSSADAFFLSYQGALATSTSKAYADIVQIGRWWDSEHTYSGKSSNLSIRPEAGGCFCEKWKDGSVEHGVVLMAMPGKMLRLRTALGPLQERALNGILTFWLRNEDSATTLTVEYRVNGSNASGLDALASSVDEVLGAQVERLRRYVATGNPEPPPEEKAAAAAAASAAKEAAEDADIAARVDELRREIQNGTNVPPATLDAPKGDKSKVPPAKPKSPSPPEHP
ncbi:MAG TPA: hypothetical protein VHE32_03200 [Rhodanobacteraceae bacterium]|nr:hypothetical protein [Rhodanobacteraceae bacterium]